jgi:hypothetical protein
VQSHLTQRSLSLDIARRQKNAVSDMPRKIAWWLTIEAVESLVERCDFPAELPPKLLALVNKLDAIEGNHLLHCRPTKRQEARRLSTIGQSVPRLDILATRAEGLLLRNCVASRDANERTVSVYLFAKKLREIRKTSRNLAALHLAS